MANIEVIDFEKADGRLKEIYQMLIDTRGKLADIHMIQSLNPESIVTHMDVYMTIMFGESPLSREQRELMAVVVSVANNCIYCQKHHGAALNKYWKNSERNENLIRDFQLAGLSFEDKLLCKFARQLTNEPGNADKISQINILRQNGFDDRSILDATLVIAYFNFVNRIVLALDVQPEADAGEGFKY